MRTIRPLATAAAGNSNSERGPDGNAKTRAARDLPSSRVAAVACSPSTMLREGRYEIEDLRRLARMRGIEL